MVVLRRRLHGWVIAWMVFQAVSLSALVPRDCCEAHRHAAEAIEPCHESAAVTHCPMPAADGTPCPMHSDRAAHHEHGPAQPAPVDDCSMRGSCNGPTLGSIALLSQSGVLTEPVTPSIDLEVGTVHTRASVQPASRLASPDPPPPRV